MNQVEENLQSKLAALLAWERRKRREEISISTLCAALMLAIGVSPLHAFLPKEELRWLVPLAWFSVLAPLFFYYRRWRHHDAVRTLTRLDKSLDLQERAVTAWELSQRHDSGGTAQLVFKQAYEPLRQANIQKLFPRHWGWPTYLAVPLLVLWFTFLWLDFDRWNLDKPRLLGSQTLAHKAREYSRELQEKAKRESLRQTLKLGQEIEKAAQKGIDTKVANESFRKELDRVTKPFDDLAKTRNGQDSLSAASEQSLKDLKAELEAARDFSDLAEFPPGSVDQQRRWMERLAALPQLKRQLERAEPGGQHFGRNPSKSFLDKLDQQVTSELDRRALIDAQQYLEQMMRQGHGQPGETTARHRGQGKEETAGNGPREKNHNNAPGKEPGKKTEEAGFLPEFSAKASTRVQGAVGKAESSVFYFKGAPAPGKTTVTQEEAVASYRRQAEQELNSERIPEALKQTIKDYFLSLSASATKSRGTP